MEPIPVPSPIHYELILQLLERQTMFAVSQNPDLKEKVQQLIISMRKAVALQKQVEEICQQKKLSVDYRWALNHVAPKSPNSARAINAIEPDLEKSPDRVTVEQMPPA